MIQYFFSLIWLYVKTQGITPALKFIGSAIWLRIVPEKIFYKRFKRKKVRNFFKSLSKIDDIVNVSVVVPVNNAYTKGVSNLVDSLERQKRVNLELIAVDSGSSDNTVEYLRSRSFNVIEIKPEDFTHAYSRNTGAENAKNEYLLFTVDDAVFTDDFWIWKAVKTLNFTKADAISGLQVATKDADPYATCLDNYLTDAQSFDSGIQVSRSGAFFTALRKIAPYQKIYRSIPIDDTNHLVKKESWEKIRFKTETVEDIDFAFRLANSGGKIAFSNFLAIQHFHEHKADSLYKYFKRIMIDTAEMKNLGLTHYPLNSKWENVSALQMSYAILKNSIDDYVELLNVKKFHDPLVTLVDDIKINLKDFHSKIEIFSRKKALHVHKIDWMFINSSKPFFDSLNHPFIAAFNMDQDYINFWLRIVLKDILAATETLSKIERLSFLELSELSNLIDYIYMNRYAAIISGSEFEKPEDIELNKFTIQDWE